MLKHWLSTIGFALSDIYEERRIEQSDSVLLREDRIMASTCVWRLINVIFIHRANTVQLIFALLI